MRTHRLRPSTRETVAHHEAGHAIALLAAAGLPARVSIVRDEESLGRVTPYRIQWATPEALRPIVEQLRVEPANREIVRSMVLTRVRYCLAGWAAESIYRSPERLVGVVSWIDDDINDAREMVGMLHADATDAARQFLTHVVLEEEYRCVRKWLRGRAWRYVEVIAGALLEREELTGEELADVLDASGGAVR